MTWGTRDMTPEKSTCMWKCDMDGWDGEIWETDCGQAWTFIDGDPEQNNVRYCHYCGKPVDAVKVTEGEA
jgi:hypothetical protein